MVDEERYVETEQLWRDKRGIVVCVISYDRQERRVIFIRPDYPHECFVPKWYFENFFRSTKGKMKAEQQQLNSRVPHCLAKARSIMRQKRRKAQPETTVHKDIVREEFVRAFNPQVADRLRQILEASRRARGGHE